MKYNGKNYIVEIIEWEHTGKGVRREEARQWSGNLVCCLMFAHFLFDWKRCREIGGVPVPTN